MNILERAKKLVCDMNPHEAKKLNMLDGRSVQTWPEWAQRDFRLACDTLVAVNEPKSELERENARLQMELDASCNAEELRQVRAENARLNDLLNPKMWTLEMSTTWHKNIPDVHAAFAALRSLPNVV